MKIGIVVSTRPEIIRLSKIIKKCEKYFDTKVIYTNQNYDHSLSTQFFEEFDIETRASFGNINKVSGCKFIGAVMPWLVNEFEAMKYDAILVLGDTNGAFAAVSVAKRLGIPIFHLEAGNRCYDTERVPEEVNRYQIDAISDWHLCYTQRAREQLLLEGKHPSKVIVVGNPIAEIINNLNYIMEINDEEYILATIHRKENISDNVRLYSILRELNNLKIKVKLSYHPSIKNKIENNFTHQLTEFKNIEFMKPSNFKEFINLEFNSTCIVTDSGTIPEEANIIGKPCVLLRYSTERPELLESNSMVMCSNPDNLDKAVEIAINENDDMYIDDYHDNVSSNVIKLLMRYEDE